MKEIYGHHYNEKNIELLELIEKTNKLFSEHEEYIANPILEFIDNNDKLNLIGKNKIKNKNRAPTISFYSKFISSELIAKELVRNNFATRNDNFYAWRCLKALGINTEDGVVRISLLHYNKKDESLKLIECLKKIIRSYC